MEHKTDVGRRRFIKCFEDCSKCLQFQSERKRGAELKVEYEEGGAEDEDATHAAKRDKWQPTLWRQQLLNIYEMRRRRDAPVDVMGCDRIADRNAEPRVGRVSRTKFVPKQTSCLSKL